MGNRAHVVFAEKGWTYFSPAVYFHWNGGPESIYQFLAELDRRKVRADVDYECARFIQIAGEFFDHDRISGLSLGVTNGPQSLESDDLKRLDHGDNGIYIICRATTPTTVRRFTKDYSDPDCPYDQRQVVEWTNDKVAQEQQEALSNAEYNGIAGILQASTEGKEICEY